MRRREAAAAVLTAVGMVTAGGTWLFGPYGLLGSGFGLLLVVLFVVDVEG